MEYSRKIQLYKRNSVEIDGIDTLIPELIGNFFAKVKYNSGAVRKFSQNGNITEFTQDITILIPRRVTPYTLKAVKDTGYIINEADGISYLINNFVISDVLNNVVLYCMEGQV